MPDKAVSTSDMLIHVLQVDDEKTLTELTRLSLEAADPSFRIVSVHTPFEALNLLREASFDCILSDYQMPGMNGVQLCIEVRKRSNVPFLLYTCRDREEVVSAAFAAGVDDYIMKEKDTSHYQILAWRIREAILRHGAEEARLLRADRYGKLFEHMQNGYAYCRIIQDDAGRPIDYVFLEVNLAFEKMLGVTKDEVVGKRLTEVFPGIEKDPADWIGMYGKVALGGGDIEFEEHSPTLGKWYSVKAFSFERGSFAVVFNDVTELKRLQIAIATDQGVVDALINAAKSVQRHSDFNESAREIFDLARVLTGAKAGYIALMSSDGSNNDVVFLESGGMPCSVDPSLPMPIRGLRAVAYRENKTVYNNEFASTEWAKFLPPGHLEINNVLFAPLIVEGRTSGILGLAYKTGGFTDRDARLATILGEFAAIALANSRKIEALEESEGRYRSLLDNVHDAVFVLDDEAYMYANRAAAEMLGYGDVGEIVGLPSFSIVAPVDRELVRQRTKARIRGEDVPSSYEIRLLRRDGVVVQCEVNVTRIIFRGKPASLGIHRDITKRMIYEESLKRSNDELTALTRKLTVVNDELRVTQGELRSNSLELTRYAGRLEELVEERTRAFRDAERRLRQQEVMAAVGRIGAMVAHDLRSPLNIISQSSQAIRQFPDKSDRLLTMIQENSARALSMIEDIRNATKEITLRVVRTNLAEMIRKEVEECNPPTGVKTEVTLGDGLDAVLLDPEIIHRVLDNIVRNAIESMPNGGVLTVAAGRDGDVVELRVSDTGVGIPEGVRDRVFEPFYTTKSKGTGLGLAYCRRGVEAHGGSITFDSLEGEGTTFKVRLPRIENVSRNR